jgi:predicted helicase
MLEYGKFWGLTDIFEEFGSGVKTDRDDLVIDFEESKLTQKMQIAFSGDYEKDFATKYNIANSSSYKFADKLKTQDFDKVAITKIQYRPFDERFIYYKQGFTSRPAFEIMQHMLQGDNIGICFKRQNKGDFDYIFISSSIIECCLFESAYANVCIAPLYLHRTAKTEGLFLEAEEQKPNFKPEFVKMIAEKFGNINPEEVLAFIYAQMHSPNYRTKYLELLKIDFPRINFDVGVDEFKRLAKIGQELIDAHLMKKIPSLKIGSCISTIGFEKITCQKPKYNETEKRIYIGKEVYFDGVSPEIWNFKIGGYQVLDKYLKERTERVLTTEEIKNVTNIIKVLGFTIGKMGEVDVG